MRLVVQVPCLNEEETLPAVLSTIPTSIPGIDEILVLITDDGSTDRTIEVAQAHGGAGDERGGLRFVAGARHDDPLQVARREREGRRHQAFTRRKTSATTSCSVRSPVAR